MCGGGCARPSLQTEITDANETRHTSRRKRRLVTSGTEHVTSRSNTLSSGSFRNPVRDKRSARLSKFHQIRADLTATRSSGRRRRQNDSPRPEEFREF